MFIFMYEILLGEIIACILGVYGLYSLNKMIINAKLLKSSALLQSKIANFKREYGNFQDESGGIVGDAIEGMGVEGILDALGIPAVFKPMAKGFVDSLLKDPEKLKALAAKIGVKLPDESNKDQSGLL